MYNIALLNESLVRQLKTSMELVENVSNTKPILQKLPLQGNLPSSMGSLFLSISPEKLKMFS